MYALWFDKIDKKICMKNELSHISEVWVLLELDLPFDKVVSQFRHYRIQLMVHRIIVAEYFKEMPSQKIKISKNWCKTTTTTTAATAAAIPKVCGIPLQKVLRR